MNPSREDRWGEQALHRAGSNSRQKNIAMEENDNDDSPCYPVAKEIDERLEKDPVPVHIPMFRPDLNNMGVDELITKSFADIFQKKVDSGEWSAKISPGNSEFDALKKCMRPAYFWGTTAAITQFCFLRWAGARTVNRSIHKGPLWPWRLLMRGRENEMLSSAKLEKSQLHNRIITRKDGTALFREGLLTKPFTLALDGAVSVVSGCLVGFVTADKLKLYDSVADIPLKAGQSPVSDVLCEDFLRQDLRIPSELWEEHDDDAMRALRRFLDNCLKRKVQERQIRRESMLNPDVPVSIPFPGVLPDILDTLEHDQGREEIEAIEVDSSHGSRVAATVAPGAWAPEDYDLWVNDVEDDWEITDDSDED